VTREIRKREIMVSLSSFLDMAKRKIPLPEVLPQISGKERSLIFQTTLPKSPPGKASKI
jgi:hypothetical protein